MSQGAGDLTLVFDKGNKSEDHLELVAKAPLHFIGSLVPNHHPEPFAVGRPKMRRLDSDQLPAVRSYRTQK